ncbi:uncharacterized protein, partial [Nicotiana tomentosiformis]|uniref:uncharacterized protein n=1 Tax=Nicotiana tomentosiformis TaxID=4098 RepID=UPI00388CC677
YHQRIPLVILVCGTACVGKSTIATQLAQRLNLPNVLQTEMVYELLRTSTDAPLMSPPVWARDFGSSEELITEFCRECRIIWKGLAGDLKKAMKDGKPIIIESFLEVPFLFQDLFELFDWERWIASSKHATAAGTKQEVTSYIKLQKNVFDDPGSLNNASSSSCIDMKQWQGIHLDPRIYLMEEEHKLLSLPPVDHEDLNFSKVKDHKEIQRESNSSIELGSQSDAKDHYLENVSSRAGASSELNKLTDSLKSMDIVNITSEDTESKLPHRLSDDAGEAVKDSGVDRTQTSGGQPIFVPIVLRMADFDHKAFLEEWVATRTFREKHPAQDKDKVITNLMTIQDYLCSFTSQGSTVVDVSAATFPQTLDWLHNYLLECLEQGF